TDAAVDFGQAIATWLVADRVNRTGIVTAFDVLALDRAKSRTTNPSLKAHQMPDARLCIAHSEKVVIARDHERHGRAIKVAADQSVEAGLLGARKTSGRGIEPHHAGARTPTRCPNKQQRLARCSRIADRRQAPDASDRRLGRALFQIAQIMD